MVVKWSSGPYPLMSKSRPQLAWLGPARERARAVGAFVKRHQSPAFRPDPGRMETGIRATRTTTLAAALLWFMAALTLDDLGVLRLPAYMVAVGGSLAIFAVAPIFAARSMVFRFRNRSEGAFESKAGERARWGALLLIATILVTIAWLVMFTAGVPPWSE